MQSSRADTMWPKPEPDNDIPPDARGSYNFCVPLLGALDVDGTAYCVGGRLDILEIGTETLVVDGNRCRHRDPDIAAFGTLVLRRILADSYYTHEAIRVCLE